MTEEQPLWRRAFDVVERAAAPRLEGVIKSEEFALAVGVMQGVQRAAQRRVERSTRRVLHFWNLPAGSDMTRILGELGELQRQVRELSKEVRDGAGR